MRSGRNRRLIGPPAGLLLSLVLSGCLAQQADLIETRTELDSRISALNKKEQELRDKIKQADSLIARLTEQSASLGAQLSELQHESSSKIEGADEKQNKRIDDIANKLDNQLQKNRIESDRRVSDTDKVLREQIASLKAEYATRLGALEGGVKDQGRGFEDQAKAGREDQARIQENLVKLRTRLEETNAAVLEVTKRFEVRLQEHDRALGAGDAKAGGIVQQLDQQGRSSMDQLAQFNRALADFKIVLTGLADKVAQQEHATQELAADLNRRTDTLVTKADADTKTTSTHLVEVNRSIGSVAKAVETLGNTLGARVDQQEQKLNEVAGAFQNMTAQVQQQDQRLAEQEQRFARQDLQLLEMSTTAAVPSQDLTPRRDLPDSAGTKRGSKTQKRLAPAESETRSPQVSGLQGSSSSPPSSAGEVAIQSQSASQSVASIAGTDKTMPVNGAGTPPAESSKAARDAYESVLIKFRQGDLEAARRGFTDFLTQFPGSDLAPNAQYWLGECYYGKRDYRRAIEAFTQVRHTYPRSEKVPAALLKASFAYIEVNERSRAAALLREILESYPKSPEAGKAGAKLAQLEKKR